MKIVSSVGKKGEDFAVAYLKRNGYRIIERNYRKNYGEIDIIAIEKDVLVFVEVKTRTSQRFGTPLEAITPWKLRSLVKTGELYAHLHQQLPRALRIDAVSVWLSDKNKLQKIALTKNIET